MFNQLDFLNQKKNVTLRFARVHLAHGAPREARAGQTARVEGVLGPSSVFMHACPRLTAFGSTTPPPTEAPSNGDGVAEEGASPLEFLNVNPLTVLTC